MFSFPLLLISVVLEHIPIIDKYLSIRIHPSVNLSVYSVIMLILSTPVQFVGGYPFYTTAFKALRKFSLDMDLLVVIATSEAYIYSIFIVIYGIFVTSITGKCTKRNSNISVVSFFEASAGLITFIHLGKWMQGIGKGKTSQSIVKLMDLQPTSAILVESGEREIPIELLKKGDIVKVIPGDKIPVDGIVTQGSSSVDESMITGESLPVTKQKNDKVISGSLNIDGVLYIQAVGIGTSSTLFGIAKLIEDAQLKKPKIQVFQFFLTRANNFRKQLTNLQNGLFQQF